MFKKAMIMTICFLVMVSFVSQASALDWHTANQSTVGWTAVTKLASGTAIPEGSIIKYQTYLANAITDPDKTNPSDTGIVETNEKIYTLGTEGKFFVGVRTLRYVDNELVGQSLDVAWSDIADFCKGGITFGLQFYMIPANIDDMYPKY